MKVNLHLHSLFSDGTQWPEEIIERALKLHLTHVALTDHDSMEGVPLFLEAAREAGIKAMAGVEIDCEAPEIAYNSEVLGYFPQGDWYHTGEFCQNRIRHRNRRMSRLIKQAAAFFHARLSLEELAAAKLENLPAGLKNPRIAFSKPDLLAYLKLKKLVPENITYPEYNKLPFLLQDADPKPTVQQVIAVIQKDRGIPVLPHPALIFNRDVQGLKSRGMELFSWFKDAGIRAVECNYYENLEGDKTEVLNTITREFAAQLGLKITWGSDCHGCGHPSSDTMEKFWGTDPFPF
jgi:predicted metal-dependent phosphoesterase TrpH